MSSVYCARGVCTRRQHESWEPYCSYACMEASQRAAVQDALLSPASRSLRQTIAANVGDTIVINGPDGYRLTVVVTDKGFRLEGWVGTLVDYLGREMA